MVDCDFDLQLEMEILALFEKIAQLQEVLYVANRSIDTVSPLWIKHGMRAGVMQQFYHQIGKITPESILQYLELDEDSRLDAIGERIYREYVHVAGNALLSAVRGGDL